MRRALEIDRKSFGEEHPEIATDFNNLAQLLQATSRLAEAEPLMKRALAIIVKLSRSIGHPHPHLNVFVNNYAALLHAMGRSREHILAALREIAPEIFS
jgi:hypothetical protein